MLELYPYNIHMLEDYLFTFYHQGGGDIVIITTPTGEFISSDLIDDASPDHWHELVCG